MKFNYQGRNKKGEIHTGQIEASSKEGAISLLQKNGLYVTFLEEAKSPLYA
ncbi:MAG: type II secretion system F family protein, partial [Candidatus Nealsonbacteria bacterium CG02_land_8_20_14_3_00_40_11]